MKSSIKRHKVVSGDKWLKARRALLVKEKKFNRLRDALSKERRALPWVEVTKDYLFEGPKGKTTLAELFDGKSQLLTYHFMFGPDWKEGCAHCSFWAEHFDGALVHLGRRDTNLIAISRAPYAKIKAFRKRMGWDFNWVSSFQSDFNFDFHVSATPQELKRGTGFYNYKPDHFIIDELPGISAFYRDKKGRIFHTYSSFARGLDLVNNTYNFLDMTAKGRDENPGSPQDWVRFHDRYPRRAR
jgi:predicted dithiol-disulfide oxidoreductase (DUF899 family)